MLELGPASRFASYFDIDWEAGDGRLLLPVVGDDDEGSIEVAPDEREVTYHELRLPMAPGTTTLGEQHYDLVNWRRGDSELNYRRFFTVTTLAGVRVEEPEVFEESHREIRRWFEVGLVDGLRVDHPDGLRDPADYLDRLSKLTNGSYVVVEKILEPGERLPDTWATAGTTGYDVLALVDRVLTDPAGEAGLTELDAIDFPALIHDTKRAVADGSLQAEVRRIVRDLPPSGAGRRAPRRGGRAPRLLPGLPLVPAARGRAPGEALATARGRRPDLSVAFDELGAGAVRPGPAGRAAVPADQRDGDGEGRRGLCLLPLLAAHLAQRGRGRPCGVLGLRRPSSTTPWRGGRPSGPTR